MRKCRQGHVVEGTYCKTCKNEYKRHYRAEHPDEKKKEYQRLKDNNPDKLAEYRQTQKTNHPLYGVWQGMLRRCTNPKHEQYADYGGRGIKVCERWQDYDTFVADMGERPSEAYTLERINNDLGYQPGNCRWATRAEQSRNSRANHEVTYKGETKCLTDWADWAGMKLNTLSMRLQRGWSFEEAIETPLS